MAAAFRPVNSLLSPVNIARQEMASPTTPRSLASVPIQDMDDATTPTRASFGAGVLASQKPLPSSPFPESVQVAGVVEKKTPKRHGSHRSRRSKDSDEMDMDESDRETAVGEDAAGSDEESVNADGTRSKKKKSLRFYCTDYPPCSLSFTRSEHLARHIRKHTGERPFQCHCSRRFSRLDNLRQHAQTVHVNEDIPIDSLAATVTRFQRQIRTDRIRPSGRARAATASSIGAPVRGHSKSLSTSSITSVSSVGSSYNANEARRRPPPLAMADPRSHHSLESYRSVDCQYYRGASPCDFSTPPTSATFSTGQSSPRWKSGVTSPPPFHPRPHSMYGRSRTPDRRLSVPSGAGNPFSSPHGAPPVRGPLFGHGPTVNTSNPLPLSPSMLPASNPNWARRDTAAAAADEAWRRRTWHPDTRDYNGASRLSQVMSSAQFPTEAPPVASLAAPPSQPSQPSQPSLPSLPLRLPGIESFDPIPHRRRSPANPSPMTVDSTYPPVVVQGANAMDDRRTVASQHWDMGLHRGLTRLEIKTPPKEHVMAFGDGQEQTRGTAGQPTVRFVTDMTVHAPYILSPHEHLMRGHHHTMSAPMATTRQGKRHGWYHCPAPEATRTPMPEGRPHVDRIVHPNVTSFQAFPARDQAPTYQRVSPGLERVPERPPQPHSDPLERLEALVAVATSKGSTATATAC